MRRTSVVLAVLAAVTAVVLGSTVTVLAVGRTADAPIVLPQVLDSTPGSSTEAGAGTDQPSSSDPAAPTSSVVVTVPALTIGTVPTETDTETSTPVTPSTSAPTATPPSTSAPSTSAPTTTAPTTTAPGMTAPKTTTTAAPTTTAPTTAKAPTTTTTTPAGPLPRQYQHLMGWVDGGKVVSLTFDDGPGPQTGKVLDILERYGITATFCQIGEQIADYPGTEQRIAQAGHTLCNHTWDHDMQLPGKPVAVIDREIQRTQDAIKAATGQEPAYYRAPGGDWGHTDLLRQRLAHFRTLPLAWAVDSEDWQKPGVAQIVDNVLSTVTPGSIILMHDAGGDRSQTLAALPKIIEKLQAQGYTFVALPQDPRR
ncbi:polysaccharide deacetylase family protein [Nakamurella sp. YIM 132087]|uniref:Polysaccharide deacetylase family protein n=1 Tax=Nakamurella alba TaxID=2665158 RepID=A0A7K1FHB5_9ACTN|nr:polysaccharide deacetylase family protein [Nakamurella alba]MTD13470.1 polysaccharide deacetylase family protein [Nakamurella alba]